MTKKHLMILLLITALILAAFLVMQPMLILHFGSEIDMLFPKGEIAVEQRNLLFVLQALMLLVIIPVYIMTFVFVWKYRANRQDGAQYDPDLVDSKLLEYIWWGVPLVMTLVVAVLTWVKTHELDPYKPLVSDKKPIKVQVVALQWRWLFIYPEENVASINFLQIPVDTPIHFEITADAPMNSFWIPSLGGQIYAMPAMKTELHLIANKTGDMFGSSANLSGEGFADMQFVVRASSQEDYTKWLTAAKQATGALDVKSYEQLAAPSRDTSQLLYTLQDNSLFHTILMKYMSH